MYAKIEPVSVGLPLVTCDALKIENVTCNALGLGGHATIQWCVSGKALGASQVGSLSLADEAYAAWGDDDEYLYRYAAEQLGLVIVEIWRALRPEAVSP